MIGNVPRRTKKKAIARYVRVDIQVCWVGAIPKSRVVLFSLISAIYARMATQESKENVSSIPPPRNRKNKQHLTPLRHSQDMILPLIPTVSDTRAMNV